jgi:hypothetical protein
MLASVIRENTLLQQQLAAAQAEAKGVRLSQMNVKTLSHEASWYRLGALRLLRHHLQHVGQLIEVVRAFLRRAEGAPYRCGQ